MHIIGYVTQNLYINNHEIIIVESNEYIPHNYGQQEQVQVGSQQWQTKTKQKNSDACETIINFVTFCANLAYNKRNL